MIRFLDDLLNNFTMYRIVLYGLRIEVGFAIMFGFFGIVPFSGWSLILSALILVTACYITNRTFAKIFNTPTNIESYSITGLILFFILAPPETLEDVTLLILGATLAMASKYIFALEKKHIFNPAAISVFLLGIFGIGAAIWWVATPPMLAITLVIGLLFVRKVRNFSMFFSFLITAFIMIVGTGLLSGRNPASLAREVIMSWPVIFFGTVMLTEPLTSPATRKLQMLYGAIVGLLFGTQFQIGPIYSTPELALLIGNIYTYFVSPQDKLSLKLKEKIQFSQHMYMFIFVPNRKVTFQPGQYMEWTLAHPKSDSRGIRRYFTLASSPTEQEIHLGIRINETGSSFKKALLTMDSTDTVIASQLSGNFLLPEDKKKKLAFVAGGIGITPFRSMTQYLIDKNQHRDIVLLYANSSPEDFIYKNIFDKAKKIVGLKTIYAITNKNNLPKGWYGHVGRITEAMIKEDIPDYMERFFYLSGPQKMVLSYQDLLKELGVKKANIVTDYFPGF